jgi:hypothetical protein
MFFVPKRKEKGYFVGLECAFWISLMAFLCAISTKYPQEWVDCRAKDVVLSYSHDTIIVVKLVIEYPTLWDMQEKQYRHRKLLTYKGPADKEIIERVKVWHAEFNENPHNHTCLVMGLNFPLLVGYDQHPLPFDKASIRKEAFFSGSLLAFILIGSMYIMHLLTTVRCKREMEYDQELEATSDD